MKILIIGSEGFIGRNCVSYFVGKGHVLTGLDIYDFPSQVYTYWKINRSDAEIDEFFKGNIFDVVINAAGSGNVSYSMTHPLSDFEMNVVDSITIMESLRRYLPATKYIHLSSAAVYGNPGSLPIKESDPVIPLSPYGWHKLIAEQLCKEYSSVFKLKTAILRPFSVYGPGLKKQLFWDMSQKIKNTKQTVVLFGTGNESRDFIYISDLVQAIECVILKAEMNGESYNVAAGEETTISSVAGNFFKLLAPDRNFEFNGQVRLGDPLNWKANISRISELGFIQKTTLGEGLQLLTSWLNQEQSH